MSNMSKVLTKEATSIEEAKALIVEELGVPAEKIAFTVLRESSKRVLGLFGGQTALVKGEVTAEQPSAAAAAYLTDVLHAMGAKDFTVTVQENENGCLISLDGEDLGFIIGRRGDTLDALQYLAGLIANRVDNAFYRVTLDIGNYREKREQSLTGLAKRLGEQTARTGRRHSLEPMNPYERRIIHTAVQGMEGVVSWSVGSEPNRHVIIGPSEDNPNKDRAERERSRGGRGGRGGKGDRSGQRSGGDRSGDRRRGNGGGSRSGRGGRDDRRDDYQITAPERPVRQFISRTEHLSMAEDVTPPSRTESEKEDNATLYGRIDL